VKSSLVNWLPEPRSCGWPRARARAMAAGRISKASGDRATARPLERMWAGRGARKNEGNNPTHSQVLSANAQVGHARWHHQRSLRRESADPPRSEDINNVLAAVTGIGAGDEIEGMLATQMIATHMAAMKALRLLKASETVPQQDSNGNLAIPRC
jgi:hypothetical protein